MGAYTGTQGVGRVPAAALAAIYDAWTAWTPTLTNLTLGAGGTRIARYRQLGKTVDYVFKFIYGTGSAVGTDPTFSLPVAPAAHYISASLQSLQIGRGFILQLSTASRPAQAYVLSGSAATIRYTNATPDVGQNITATAPWTWTTGATLSISGTYEAA